VALDDAIHDGEGEPGDDGEDDGCLGAAARGHGGGAEQRSGERHRGVVDDERPAAAAAAAAETGLEAPDAKERRLAEHRRDTEHSHVTNVQPRQLGHGRSVSSRQIPVVRILDD